MILNSPPVIKLVVFDLGDVILKLNWEKPLSALKMAHANDKELFHRILTSHEGSYDLYERGKIQGQEFFTRFKAELAIDSPTETIETAWESLVDGPTKGIEGVLDQIPDKFPLYLLSNITENLYQYLKLGSVVPRFPVLSRFKKTYASFLLQARKPELQIYRQVFEDLKKVHSQLLPSEILFIDDRQDNVKGAQKAGFVAETCRAADAKDIEAILKRHRVI